jgi:membrane protein involved in colicin uptake
MIQKDELIESIQRWAPGKSDRRVRESKTVEQLKEILAAAVTAFTDEQQDRLDQIQADRQVEKVIHQLRQQQAEEPRRQAEALDQEKKNRRVFAEAAKALGFSECEANYSVIASESPYPCSESGSGWKIQEVG